MGGGRAGRLGWGPRDDRRTGKELQPKEDAEREPLLASRLAASFPGHDSPAGLAGGHPAVAAAHDSPAPRRARGVEGWGEGCVLAAASAWLAILQAGAAR